jgi:HD-GYP domain-containing protein (c-di-GMP phosphodiesterase class II)
MRGSSNIKAKIYFSFVIGFGFLVVFHLFKEMDTGQLDWLGFFLFVLLAILAEWLPVKLPHGGTVSVGFAMWCAAIFLFQPFFAALVAIVAIIGDIFADRRDTGKWLLQVCFNSGQLAISVGVSALLFQYLKYTLPAGSLFMGIAAIASWLTLLIINTSLVTVAFAFSRGLSPQAVWISNMRWAIPNSLALMPLGYLIAQIYLQSGPWGVILFFIPLLIARYSFQAYIDLRENFLDTIRSLTAALDAKDPYTRGHSDRVAGYVVEIARRLKMPEDQVEDLKYIALLHDAGKIGTSEQILHKPGRLNDDEFQKMQCHSAIGADIVRNVKMLAKGAEIIRHHHERWDGRGYPDGKKGDEIPVSSRIIAVADAFDAMISDRPYRAAMSPEAALQEITRCAGTQLDPRIVQAFVDIYPSLSQTAKGFATGPGTRVAASSKDSQIPPGSFCQQENYTTI